MSIDDDMALRATTTLQLAGNVVIVRVYCKDEYEAMLIHDKLEHAANHGGAFLQFERVGTVRDAK